MNQTRYTLLLDDTALQNIERLQQTYQLSTKAEVFELAMRLLTWATDHAIKGDKIGRCSNGEFHRLLLPLPISASCQT